MTTRVPPLRHVHQTIRNPWGGPASTSSGSSRTGTYHCPADWYEPQYSQPARTPSPQYDVIEGPRLNRLSAGSRAVTPASTVHTHIEGTVDPCGGHCRAFETFCHYCLQVAFIAGILTGVSLVIAGSVLRGQKRGGDLMVLVYIGCLTAMVCTLLLSVQCCVRRNVKRRKRARPQAIPLQDLPLTVAPQLPLGLPQCEPLLRPTTLTRGLPEPLHRPTTLTHGLPEPLHRPTTLTRGPPQCEPLLRPNPLSHIPDPHHLANSIARGDHSGIPWWRKQAQPHSCKLPHSHVQVPL